ncbi:Type II secretion system protein G [Frondihabitans sp. 762G35]|uniref:type II secretion system protein n=1 Tax=Frondihabitans sp. 762G35 TaxID=1446794 RepID=UPI000D201C1F|nr:Type II secretion system protein G [Frondihabitans sp. 762G35]
MYFTLMGKLNARRKNIAEQDDKGFTLIELLVVVIIIGILAAIAIPVYLGVQNNAKNSGTQSDITNVKTAVVSLQTNNGALPTKWTAVVTSPTGFPIAQTGGATTDFPNAGATLSSSTTSLNYGPTGTSGDFCIIGISKGGGTFYATSTAGVSTTACTIS